MKFLFMNYPKHITRERKIKIFLTMFTVVFFILGFVTGSPIFYAGAIILSIGLILWFRKDFGKK